MQDFIDLLVALGPAGMFISAFLAGSVLPFSSEIVMLALLAAGSPPMEIFLTASVGNVLGAMLNFYIGRLGKDRWVTDYLHIRPERLARAQRWVYRYGAWIGFFAWVPVLGSVITVALGYMRAHAVRAFAFITLGKVMRYWILLKAFEFC